MINIPKTIMCLSLTFLLFSSCNYVEKKKREFPIQIERGKVRFDQQMESLILPIYVKNQQKQHKVQNFQLQWMRNGQNLSNPIESENNSHCKKNILCIHYNLGNLDTKSTNISGKKDVVFSKRPERYRFLLSYAKGPNEYKKTLCVYSKELFPLFELKEYIKQNFLDMTSEKWKSLKSNDKKLRIIKQYQISYADAHQLKTEKQIRYNNTEITMILIPPGCYRKDEIHKHFWISKRKIDEGQWDEIMHSTTKKSEIPKQISWNQSVQFVSKLQTQVKNITVPYAPQWEYVQWLTYLDGKSKGIDSLKVIGMYDDLAELCLPRKKDGKNVYEKYFCPLKGGKLDKSRNFYAELDSSKDIGLRLIEAEMNEPLQNKFSSIEHSKSIPLKKNKTNGYRFWKGKPFAEYDEGVIFYSSSWQNNITDGVLSVYARRSGIIEANKMSVGKPIEYNGKNYYFIQELHVYDSKDDINSLLQENQALKKWLAGE